MPDDPGGASTIRSHAESWPSVRTNAESDASSSQGLSLPVASSSSLTVNFRLGSGLTLASGLYRRNRPAGEHRRALPHALQRTRASGAPEAVSPTRIEYESPSGTEYAT